MQNTAKNPTSPHKQMSTATIIIASILLMLKNIGSSRQGDHKS